MWAGWGIGTSTDVVKHESGWYISDTENISMKLLVNLEQLSMSGWYMFIFPYSALAIIFLCR